MNKNTKIMIIGSLAVALVIGGGITYSNSVKDKAWAAPAVLTSDGIATIAPDELAAITATGAEATDKPAREAGGVDGAAATDGKGGKEGKGGKGGKRDQGCVENNGDGGMKGDKPAVSGGPNPSAGAVAVPTLAEQAVNTVVISGGLETDSQDHGRPVVLIAAALGVPTEVFREAFSGVTPAGTDGGPSSELAQRNKEALMKVLAPLGITNDRLDEVSNYYRYNGSKGEMWKHIPATATVTVTNGVVTGVKITNAGAGYSSAPTISIKGPDGKIVTATATVSYTEDFKTNGSITAITIKK